MKNPGKTKLCLSAINDLKVFFIVKKKGEIKMKVCVDPELCSGCGPCVDICPEAFELNEAGIAVVKVDEVPAELQDACKEAADNCPTEAILIAE